MDNFRERFDKWRVRYDPALFSYIVEVSNLGPDKSCLEIGPGTGQASDFAIQSGCDYLAIELGEHLTDKMREKYSSFDNFHIVNADFEIKKKEQSKPDDEKQKNKNNVSINAGAKFTVKKSSAVLKWGKVKGADGYEIYGGEWCTEEG
ncbi:MAG: hypothetical protein K6B68_00615 [Eubacterium sp.]|nr:hypothetical protein [Eubacterium sp.]